MISESESHIRLEGQKTQAKVRKIYKSIKEFIEYVYSDTNLIYKYESLKPESNLLKPFQKLIYDEDIYFIDCNNNIIPKEKVLIDSGYPNKKDFFFYTLVNDQKFGIKIVEDPANPINFIPKIIPIIWRFNLIEDFAKIELVQEEKPYYCYDRKVYLRYSWGYSTDLEKKNYIEFCLDHYPLMPKEFEYIVRREIEIAYYRWKNEKNN